MENNINPQKSQKEIAVLKEKYLEIKKEIEARLNEFCLIRERGDDFRLLQELVFCLLTPQSKAKNSWQAVNTLTQKELILSDNIDAISEVLRIVRFKNNKARYIVEARGKFFENGHLLIKDFILGNESAFEKREWLVKSVKGYGYKEASHFLRNIGFYDDLTILDRHILRNLVIFEVIKEIPPTLTKKNYLIIESAMIDFAKEINISLGHLDLLFWHNQTGEIYK